VAQLVRNGARHDGLRGTFDPSLSLPIFYGLPPNPIFSESRSRPRGTQPIQSRARGGLTPPAKKGESTWGACGLLSFLRMSRWCRADTGGHSVRLLLRRRTQISPTYLHASCVCRSKTGQL